jgi:acyl-CoA synthetase (AMP-forming)/AMP-acid ligase II
MVAERMTLFNLLSQSARRYPTRGAVYLGDEQRITYGELEARASHLAGALRTRAAPGDRIMIASKNCPEYVEIMFATWAAGMVIIPVNAKLHEREIAVVVDDAEPAVIFASESIAQVLAPLMHEADARRIVVIDSKEYGEMQEGRVAAVHAAAPDDLAWLFYTSGTTGRPKGAMLTHRNLLAMAIAHLADFDNVGEPASLLHAAPMSHGSGLYLLPYIARAARQIIPKSAGYDTSEFFDLCELHPSVGAFLAPTMLQRLRVEVERRGRKPAQLALIVYGGGPMYLDELKRSLQVFGPVLAHLYGQGESPMTITGLSRTDHINPDESVLGSVGWPRSGVEVAIFNGDDRPLPAGEVGEIVCRSDVVMSGYWKNPAATEATLRGGWLHTGDIGSLAPNGLLTLRDRSKDLIISGGSNIYPREVEEVLLDHPNVIEAAVVGRSDPEWGEIVVAFIVAHPARQPTEAELDAHCLARMARFKRPKIYVFRQELPKNSYGKILKRELTGPQVALPQRA